MPCTPTRRSPVANFAVTDAPRFTVTVQVAAVPVQSPCQPRKAAPGCGVAVSVTVVPRLTTSSQSLPQLMPVPVTVPGPSAWTDRRLGEKIVRMV
ncbi:hypothetical protein BWI17_13120 [Betaproteobacteria bacterium GR16-43]|nr:hypothetical protein BWI17_13120 [Betaproteobacteria bacterium GR16-43]